MKLYLCIHTLGGKIFGIGTSESEARRDYTRKYILANGESPEDLTYSFYTITESE